MDVDDFLDGGFAGLGDSDADTDDESLSGGDSGSDSGGDQGEGDESSDDMDEEDVLNMLAAHKDKVSRARRRPREPR